MPAGPSPRWLAVRFDQRGIAQDTAIVMAALILLAVAFAAVLVARVGEVTSEIERDGPASFRNEAVQFLDSSACRRHGYAWDTASGTCG